MSVTTTAALIASIGQMRAEIDRLDEDCKALERKGEELTRVDLSQENVLANFQQIENQFAISRELYAMTGDPEFRSPDVDHKTLLIVPIASSILAEANSIVNRCRDAIDQARREDEAEKTKQRRQKYFARQEELEAQRKDILRAGDRVPGEIDQELAQIAAELR